MKILVFGDVHGCLNSLNALKDSEDFKSADMTIFLGDVVMGCSRPNECIDLLKGMGCMCLLGNNDSYICAHIPLVDLEEFDEVKKEQIRYMQDVVSETNKEIMRSWPRGMFLKDDSGKVFYFTHYAWEEYNDDKNVKDNPSVLSFESRNEMFEDIEADYYFFAHEHMYSSFNNEDKYFYCLGTVGLENPGYYLVIDTDKGITIEEKFIRFNMKEELKLMDEAGYPYGKSNFVDRLEEGE